MAHGLQLYIKDAITCISNDPHSDVDVFSPSCVAGIMLFDTGLLLHSMPVSDTETVSLLEYVIQYQSTGHRRNKSCYFPILTSILDYKPFVGDREIIIALETAPVKFIKKLLQHRGDGPLNLNSGLEGCIVESEVSIEGSEEVRIEGIKKGTRLGPLWLIARRKDSTDFLELLDFFLNRGERINAQCGPTGTSLHAAALAACWHAPERDTDILNVLLKKGSNINESGPEGNALEVIWNRVHTSYGNVVPIVLDGHLKVIRFLLEHGAFNNRPDPNGTIPDEGRMRSLSFGGLGGYWESRSLYFGEDKEIPSWCWCC